MSIVNLKILLILEERLLSLTMHVTSLIFNCFVFFFLNHTFKILSISRFISKMFLKLATRSNSSQPFYLQNCFYIWTKFQTHSSVVCVRVLKIVCNTALHQSNAQIHGKKEGRMTYSSHKPVREAEWGYRWNFPSLISLWHHVQWQTFTAAARQSGVSNRVQGDTQGLQPKKKGGAEANQQNTYN